MHLDARRWGVGVIVLGAVSVSLSLPSPAAADVLPPQAECPKGQVRASDRVDAECVPEGRAPGSVPPKGGCGSCASAPRGTGMAGVAGIAALGLTYLARRGSRRRARGTDR